MIAGFYYDQRVVQAEKVPSFYLPNKTQFNASIGLDFENRSCKIRSINEEIIILAHFCEIIGPMHLTVHPHKHGISNEIIDMIVLKAMSVDYQACERGDVIMDSTTQTLILDCSIPFFVHYFTLWDVYARGYVRPCCIIVCCRDKIRARELFIAKHSEINKVLRPLLFNNITHFHHELQTSKEMIDKMLHLNENDNSLENKLFYEKEFNANQLKHLHGEYCSLISSIHEQNKNFEVPKRSKSCDVLLDVNVALNSNRRELRSVYTIMQTTEEEMMNLLASVSKIFSNTSVSESFSLRDSDSHKDLNSSLFNTLLPNCYSKYNVQYFSTAFAVDKHFPNVDKSIPLCLCRTILDNLSPVDKSNSFRELQMDFIFPNLVNIKANQCHFVSNLCKSLGISVVTKLISCLFNQFHLIIYVSAQQSYFSLMSFLMLFLPKPHNLNYFVCKPDWPNLEQLKDSPVIFLNKETKCAEIPLQLQEFVAIYDYSTNEYVSGPKYCKGHISHFFETFKHLEYNHLHLESIVNIMLLSYVDMIYQWTSLMGRRDRRWITEEYLIKFGYSQEDVIISEKLTLFVLQTLTKSKQTPSNYNWFLLSQNLFSNSFRREGK